MKKYRLQFVFIFILLCSLIGCTEDKETNNNFSRVQLMLIDAPGDYLEVNIEIIDIQYKTSEEGWISFTPVIGYPIQVDLAELIGGKSLILTDEEIPSGTLEQVRLILSDNNTLLIEGNNDGATISAHLDTPSAQQSGLKLKIDSELEPGFYYSFILDWDVNQSVKKAGNSGKYILKPVIRVKAEAVSGSIMGKVIAEDLDDEIDGPVALENARIDVYNSNEELITSTFSNENGDFIIKGLEAGAYLVRIVHLDYIEFESEESIEVRVGEITPLGTIELQVPV